MKTEGQGIAAEQGRPTARTVRLFTVWDGLCICLLAAAAAGTVPLLNRYRPATVRIFRDNAMIAEYPLTEDRELGIKGHDGPMSVIVHGRRVHVARSSCPRQICVHSGEIGLPFQQLVCAPNHVLIEISAHAAKDSLDAVAR